MLTAHDAMQTLNAVLACGCRCAPVAHRLHHQERQAALYRMMSARSEQLRNLRGARTRMICSPSPVATAAPAVLSA